MATGAGRLRLTFTSGGGAVASDTSATFVVFPVNALYADVSDSAGVNYDGTPYSAVNIDYDGDGADDLFVSIQQCDGCSSPGSKLYQNQSDQGGAIHYLDYTGTQFAAGSSPHLGALGVAIADYDNDGDEDFFLAHQEDPQLFRNSSGVFTDVASNTSVFPAAVQDSLTLSYCANWVDYDHDGDVDLYVGRAKYNNAGGIGGSGGGAMDDVAKTEAWPDALFENTSGVFSEVGQASGLVSGDGKDAGATLSVVWADFDTDGKWEVVVGDYGEGTANTSVFEEVGGGVFAENAGALPAGISTGSVSGLQAVDFDRDNDLDLVFGRTSQTSYVLENVSADTLAEFSSAIALDGGAGWEAAGCSIVDYDLNGWPDVLLPNRADGHEPQLWANLSGNSEYGVAFVNIASEAGLTASSGAAQGVSVGDMNSDGDADILLGRASATGRVFKNITPDSTDTPTNHWVGFKLVPGNEDNGSAIGTTISLASSGGTPTLGMQIVDGGSGRGGQAPHVPIFGLGEQNESILATIQWPAGRTMDFSISPMEFDGIVEVTQTSSLSIDDSSVAFMAEVYPSDLVDWVFTWETDYWSDVSQDQVEVEQVTGSSCADLGDGYLESADSGVACSITYYVDPVTSAVSFKHELRWQSQTCYPGCTYRYRVHSGNGTTSDESPASPSWKNISFKLCPHSN